MPTEDELENYRQQYFAGMRAMSKDEMEKIALEQAEGMRQAMRGDDYYFYMRGMAQLSSSWPQEHVDEQPRPAPLTRWKRFRQWWRENFSWA